jgi:hypothetical protein
MQGLLRRRGWIPISFAALYVGLIAFMLLAHNLAQAQPNGIDGNDCRDWGDSGPWLAHCPERVPVTELNRSTRTGMTVVNISDLRSVTATLEFDPQYLEIVETWVDPVRNDPCAVAPTLVITPGNDAGTLDFSAHFDPPLGDGCTLFLIDWKVKGVSPSGVTTPTFSLHTMTDSQGKEIPHHTKPPSEGCVVSGRVKLDGRADYAGTHVILSTREKCPTNWKYLAQEGYPGTLLATTDSLGDFTLDSRGQPCLCLFAHKRGYLTAQGEGPMKGQVAKAPIKLHGGDATGDDAVNIFDLALIASHYDRNDDPLCGYYSDRKCDCDINGDGKCNVYDLAIAACNVRVPRGPQPWP